jgi:hypothetical protein
VKAAGQSLCIVLLRNCPAPRDDIFYGLCHFDLIELCHSTEGGFCHFDRSGEIKNVSKRGGSHYINNHGCVYFSTENSTPV